MYINSIYVWYLILWIIVFAIVFQKSLKIKNNDYVRINSYMLGPDELKKYAEQIAKTHQLSEIIGSPKSLIGRLDDNFLEITSVYKSLNADSKNSSAFSPAAEWLLDNFYIVEEQVKIIRRDLINHKKNSLGMLKTGYLKGFPRVYAVALELVAHLDGKLEDNTMGIFLKAYQSQNALTMSELWILPLMLETALIENIRMICEKIIDSYVERQKVEWLMAGGPEDDIKNILDEIGIMRSVNSPFVEHLVKLIRKEGLDQGQILSILDKKLEEFDTKVEKIVQEEHQEQAARQLTMGNSIISLKYIAHLAWNEIFEQLSRVEEILHQDPAGIYGQMDFESRDYYRQEVEKLAGILQISETNIARKAVELSRAAANDSSHNKQRHVGFYLIGEGRQILANQIDDEVRLDQVKFWIRRLYILPITVLTAAMILAGSCYAYLSAGTASIWISLLAGTVTLVPSLSMSINLVNWGIMHLVDPKKFPRLKFDGGVPPDAATILVIPALLSNVRQASRLADQLEVHYHSNREKNLYFAVLGDFPDADQEITATDQEITEAVLQRIRRFNQKYSPDEDIFFYFQRGRKFSPQENKWRGWERKRGAIAEFNELIRGADGTSFNLFSGDRRALQHVQYAVMINDGTKIPIGMVKKMIGTITHPLNKAVFDPVRGIVAEGYAMIQPKISVNLEKINSSFFTRIFSGQTGFDPDTQAHSDIFQDLFDEGSFTGQGIYNIDIYREALGHSFPDNAVLSPDLIAGCYLRTGLATQLNLVTGFPSACLLWMAGMHRRVRGDWQLSRWLLRRLKNQAGEEIVNPLSSLCKWKILNNLRKAVEPISLLGLLTLGPTIFPGQPLVWLGFGLLALSLTLILDLGNYLLAKHYTLVFYRSYGNFIYGSMGAFYQSLVYLIFLPYNAYLMVDAMIRTIYRLLFSHKNRWQWVSNADAQRIIGDDYLSYIQRMYPSLFISLAFFAEALYSGGMRLFLSLPLIVLWVISPVVACYISRLDRLPEEPLEAEEKNDLRLLARKTWHYYEDMVTAENNYLPPDNFQEDPFNGAALRTSPTNIGLYLLAVIAARDMGFVSLTAAQGLLEKTIAVIEKMDKWHGHLFNWYDIRSLEILRPRYISSVDSGNFLSHLIALKQAILEDLHRPIINGDMVSGLEATLACASRVDLPEMEMLRRQPSQAGLTITAWREYLQGLAADFIVFTPWENAYLKMIGEFTDEMDRLIIDPQTISLAMGISGGSDGIREIVSEIQYRPSLTSLSLNYGKLLSRLEELNRIRHDANGDMVCLKDSLVRFQGNVDSLIAGFENLISRIDLLSENTQLKPLYSLHKHLFSIGYNLEEEKLTDSYYDLLASEARITSFLAVIRREVSPQHWFKLGKALVDIEGYRGLVSWTGTMFEYFMPALIMKNFRNTILDETYHFVIDAQQMYGERRNVPWGTSESGYYAFDLQLNYQYQAFGVPDLGLKRGLIKDMVVSPYSCVLALSFDRGVAWRTSSG